MTDTDPGTTVIESKVAPSFVIRCFLVGLLCLVLGLWGIWDYVEIIPNQERSFSRAEVCRTFNRYAEPILSQTSEPLTEEKKAFFESVLHNLKLEGGPEISAEINSILATQATSTELPLADLETLLNQDVLPKAIQTWATDHGVSEHSETQAPPNSRPTWLATETAMVTAARRGRIDLDQLRKAALLAEGQLQLYGEAEQPSSYDRPVQWLFILCLPFAPWYGWQLIQQSRRRYRLLPDGTLELPGETWQPEDLVDIDMSRWMRSSKAWVVHQDGHRVLLDDYVFKNMFRLIGSIASARDPNAWTDEAKPVKKPENEEVDDS